jgi:copper chaperone CopZ
MTTQEFKLENLSCPSCVMHIEAMEDKAGISKVDANFKKQTMTVRYDEALQTPGDIVKLVSEMGYIAIPHQSADNNHKGSSLWTKFFRS